MLEHRDVPVQQLQHQIVDALQAAAGGRIRRVARKLLELVVDPADHAVDPAVDDRMGVAQQHRRREFLVEDDRLVAHFEDSRDAKADIAGLCGLAQLEAEARIGDVDLLLDAQRRGGIDEGLGADDIAAALSASRSSTSRVLAAATGIESQTIWPAAASGTSMAGGSGLSAGMLKGVPSGITPVARRSANLLCWARSRSISSSEKPHGYGVACRTRLSSRCSR